MHISLRSVALAATATLALAGCSSERESSSGSASADACASSSSASQQFEASVKQSEAQLGLSGLEIDPGKLCDVDTAKFKKDEPAGGYRIALAAQGPTNSWAVTNEEMFKYRAKERGAKVLYASANGDANRQVDNIQQLASQQPDAMVVVPMGDAITGQVRAAAKQDIPVVLCAGRLGDGSGAVSTVTRNYELQGTMSAEWLAEQIGGKGRIAMLSGIAGVPTAEFQKAAAEKVFEKYPDIEVVAKEYTDWSPTKAKTVASTLVPKRLDAVWSDSGISDLGVLEAYQSAGEPVPPMTGDGSNAFVKAVGDADVKYAITPFPPEQSAQCLDTAMDILAGKTVPNVVNVEATSFTNENAAEYAEPQCTDDLWIPSELPDVLKRRLDLC